LTQPTSSSKTPVTSSLSFGFILKVEVVFINCYLEFGCFKIEG
jgi:hypothetical protein